MPEGRWWISRDAMLLNLSAFFADMGYQAVLAGFPIFLVIVLGAPAYMLGIVYAIAYGGGAIAGYLGGYVGDRSGRKRVAVTGNSLVLMLSGLGFVATVPQAIALFSAGWWSRDSRTPARRAMLSEAVEEKQRGRAFGLLHAFDIGGGAIAVSYLLVLVYLGVGLQSVFMLTAIPLVVSTLCLVFVRAGKRRMKARAARPTAREVRNRGTMRGILMATALFGFSFYSLGFPILTIAQESGSLLGIASYMVFLAVSAVTGYAIGVKARELDMVRWLSLLGYALAALASLLIGLAYLMHLAVWVSYLGVALMGVALGSIETFEPTIISFASSNGDAGRKMGYLTASRSVGLFTANLSMGVLYILDPAYSYFYAAAVSIAAAAILLYLGKGFRA